ncbi:MAG: hypothetical protein CMJ78_11865 [Planctomycetaceae bacterium]|nr:hypothetical protein [Planctomycetaceae bacterium]
MPKKHKFQPVKTWLETCEQLKASIEANELKDHDRWRQTITEGFADVEYIWGDIREKFSEHRCDTLELLKTLALELIDQAEKATVSDDDLHPLSRRIGASWSIARKLHLKQSVQEFRRPGRRPIPAEERFDLILELYNAFKSGPVEEVKRRAEVRKLIDRTRRWLDGDWDKRRSGRRWRDDLDQTKRKKLEKMRPEIRNFRKRNHGKSHGKT